MPSMMPPECHLAQTQCQEEDSSLSAVRLVAEVEAEGSAVVAQETMEKMVVVIAEWLNE